MDIAGPGGRVWRGQFSSFLQGTLLIQGSPCWKAKPCLLELGHLEVDPNSIMSTSRSPYARLSGCLQFPERRVHAGRGGNAQGSFGGSSGRPSGLPRTPRTHRHCSPQGDQQISPVLKRSLRSGVEKTVASLVSFIKHQKALPLPTPSLITKGSLSARCLGFFIVVPDIPSKSYSSELNAIPFYRQSPKVAVSFLGAGFSSWTLASLCPRIRWKESSVAGLSGRAWAV